MGGALLRGKGHRLSPSPHCSGREGSWLTQNHPGEGCPLPFNHLPVPSRRAGAHPGTTHPSPAAWGFFFLVIFGSKPARCGRWLGAEPCAGLGVPPRLGEWRGFVPPHRHAESQQKHMAEKMPAKWTPERRERSSSEELHSASVCCPSADVHGGTRENQCSSLTMSEALCPVVGLCFLIYFNFFTRATKYQAF